jgi:hypothetical protein
VQVRQPLYASSVGRWRLYEQELEPLRAQLAAEGVAIGPDDDVPRLAPGADPPAT